MVAEIPIAVLLLSSALRIVRVSARRVFAIGSTEPLWHAPLLLIDEDPDE